METSKFTVARAYSDALKLKNIDELTTIEATQLNEFWHNFVYNDLTKNVVVEHGNDAHFANCGICKKFGICITLTVTKF